LKVTTTKIEIEPGLEFDAAKVIRNPSDEWYADFLKPYYVVTKDGQYLFGSLQPGRSPSRAFNMVPGGYRLGMKQLPFAPGVEIGRWFYQVVKRYLTRCKVILLDSIQGEAGSKVGLRIVVSVENPHSAYIAWMGKLMTFPYKAGVKISCWNYIVPEPLPPGVEAEVRSFWPDYEADKPISLYDFTRMDEDIRQVVSVRFDYFGAAFKKPNLTMVWNRGESEGMISYHAGCTSDRILKGLSGTGKTTLTVGLELEQDDALLGKPFYEDGKIIKVQLIGLEAASYAKSEGITEESPEYPGLMRSAQVGPDGKRPVVLAQNIDCEDVDYIIEEINGYKVKVPRSVPGQEVGSLTCTRYQSSGTTNGRFIFQFSELNPKWGSGKEKWLRAEGLSYKRFDVMEPIFRVVDPAMAVALDAGCESIITSALADQPVGTRVRSYAATDFMVREQCHQAMFKWKVYSDLGLGLDGKLVFFITNSGYVGEFDIHGRQVLKLDDIHYQGRGEKITVEDSKTLIDLVGHRKIESWIEHPAYGYLIPDPRELEDVHGMAEFGRRFNPLRFYTPREVVEFWRRDIIERTQFLRELFRGQELEDELRPVIEVWQRCRLPSPSEVRAYYEKHHENP
jgi:hypothetical protein